MIPVRVAPELITESSRKNNFTAMAYGRQQRACRGKYDGYLYLKSSSPDFPDEKIELEMNVLDIDLKQIKVDSFNYNFCLWNVPSVVRI